jgi:hypothetical protein
VIRIGVTGEYDTDTDCGDRTMAAANLTAIPELELEQVERWRLDSLRRAGYDPEAATVLAASHEVDLHRAIDLLAHGCPPAIALQILL